MPRPKVYLLCFSSHYKHARHYIGYAKDLDHRLEEHRAGRGARLVEVIIAAGLTFVLSRTWNNGTRRLERKLKNWKKSQSLCPLCRAAVGKPIKLTAKKVKKVA